MALILKVIISGIFRFLYTFAITFGFPSTKGTYLIDSTTAFFLSFVYLAAYV